MKIRRKQQLICLSIIILLCILYEVWFGRRLSVVTSQSVMEVQAMETAQTEEDTLPETEETAPASVRIERHELGADQNKITYYLADVRVSDATELHTALAHDTYGNDIKDSLSNIAGEHDAYFAINGDFYGYRWNGIVIRDGVLYRDDPTDRDCMVLYQDGTAGVVKESETSGQELLDAGAWNVFSFGPTLVRDGKEEPNLKEAYKVDSMNVSISGVEPRTGIGYLEPNHYLFLAVDGRQEGYSRGMDFEEMAKVFEEAGCEYAYNLDGGGSVTLYEDGSVINSPCAWMGGERDISDIIYVDRKDVGL